MAEDNMAPSASPAADQAADRQWRAGFLAGWNAGIEGDEAKLRAAQNRVGKLADYEASASPAALTDEQIIALADRGEYLTPSPSKYPEARHGTQYRCGAPGLLGFARALLAASPAAPAPKCTRCEYIGKCDCKVIPAPAAQATNAATDLSALVKYLREEADFNRSWTDGRRGGPADPSEEYVIRRLELAARSDGWADAVQGLIVAPAPAAQADYEGLRHKFDEEQRNRSPFQVEVERMTRQQSATPQTSAKALTFAAGIEAAAKWVDKRREDHDSEFGAVDPDTGAFEFRSVTQEEYSAELYEVAEGIRALLTAEQPSEDKRDSERLDFLDGLNRRLNEHYGTVYGWELILSPNIVRLMSGPGGRGHLAAIDLNDSKARGAKSCREAIDAAIAKGAE